MAATSDASLKRVSDPPGQADREGDARAPRPRLLVVDDERAVLSSLQRLFLKKQFDVTTVEHPHGALSLLEQQEVDVALIDLMMPHVGGLELLERIKALSPATEVIIMTGHASVQSAIAAVRNGAFDYLTKPFENNEHVVFTVEKALKQRSLLAHTQRLEQELSSRAGFRAIIGQSPRMMQVFQLVEHVAASSANVLIQGETGTGKELVARAIHERSDRKRERLVTLNCSALTESLLESELFGYTKGSFTGANQNKKGLFEAAHRGTLFLDEIGDMHPSTQVKVLRVLQDGEVRPIGASDIVRVDVRVIAATNVDLEKAMATGAFRSDLYWRLNVINIQLPALRERPEDIPLLAMHFLRVYADKARREVSRISEAAMDALVTHPWPGNVRELENVIERAVVLCQKDFIDVDDLPGHLRRVTPREVDFSVLMDLPFREAKDAAVSAFERRYVEALLERTRGNVSECARLAQLDRSNFRRLLNRHGLDQRAFRGE